MDKQSPISVIAWDLDNTLFDRDAAFTRFIEAWLRRNGAPADAAAHIMQFDRSGDGDRMEFCRLAAGAAGLGPGAAEELWDATLRELPGYIEPDPRIADVLRTLAPDFTLAVVSNGNGPLQRAKLAHARVGEFIDPSLVVISGDAGCNKPDARIFEILLDRAHVAPERVLFAGDHLQNDITGAAAVGMRTCWIARGREQPAGLAADIVVDYAWELHPGPVGRLAAAPV